MIYFYLENITKDEIIIHSDNILEKKDIDKVMVKCGKIKFVEDNFEICENIITIKLDKYKSDRFFKVAHGILFVDIFINNIFGGAMRVKVVNNIEEIKIINNYEKYIIKLPGKGLCIVPFEYTAKGIINLLDMKIEMQNNTIKLRLIMEEKLNNNMKYSIILKNIEIGSEIKFISYTNNVNEIESYLDFSNLGNLVKKGTWMFSLVSEYNGYKIYSELISTESFLGNDSLILSDYFIYRAKIFTAQDKRLGLKIYDSPLIINIKEIIVKENIIFKFNIENKENTKILNYYLVNSDYIYKTNKSYDLKKNNDEYIIEIEKEHINNLGEGKYFIELEYAINNYINRTELKFNSDSIYDKEKFIRYPNLNLEENLNLSVNYLNQMPIIDILSNQIIDLESIYYKNEELILKIKNDISVKAIYNSYNLILNNLKNNKEIIIKPNEIDKEQLVFKYNVKNLNIKDKYSVQLQCLSDKKEINKNILTGNIFDKNKRKIKFDIIKREFILFSKEKNRLIIRKENLLSNHYARFIQQKMIDISSKFSKNKKEIWLIGENLGQTAQDNGISFFKHCIDSNIDKDIFYVIRKEQMNLPQLKGYESNILEYDSYVHKKMYSLSKYSIVSHGIRDVMPSYIHNQMKNNSKDVIYLQHGIVAMKKLNFSGNSYNKKIVKFIVSSEHERDIFINQMKFSKKQILISGLSRFDNLVNKSTLKNKNILIMPTWREWLLDSKDNFINSRFYENYISLLNDEKFNELLEKNNIMVNFFAHIEIQNKYINLFENRKNIKIINFSETSLSELIMNANLLITDYSSVAFDFNYLNKPVVFYQFDIEEYLYNRGSYVNLKTDLPGDTCENKDELVRLINSYINTDFEYKDKYTEISKKYYDFRDKQNNKRICDAILKLK